MTVANELGKFKHLEDVGGIAYLASLTEGMPRLENIESYTRIVKHKSILRTLIHTARDITANCIQEGREVDEILADAERAVMKVGGDLLRSGPSRARSKRWSSWRAASMPFSIPANGPKDCRARSRNSTSSPTACAAAS